MKIADILTFSTLVFTLGFLLGAWTYSFKIDNHQIFYIDNCLVNNKVDINDLAMINQCKQSFEIFKVKE